MPKHVIELLICWSSACKDDSLDRQGASVYEGAEPAGGKERNSKSQKVNFRWRVETTGWFNHRISNQASGVRVRQTAGGDCFREAVVLSETAISSN